MKSLLCFFPLAALVLFFTPELRSQTCVEHALTESGSIDAAVFHPENHSLFYSILLRDASPSPRTLLRLHTGNGVFSFPGEEEFRKAAPSNSAGVSVSSTSTQAQICYHEKNEPVCWNITPAGKIILSEGEAIRVFPSSDGKQAALLRREEEGMFVETYSSRGARTARFAPQNTGLELMGIDFLGGTLLLRYCAAGPYCSGYVANATTGRFIQRVNYAANREVNFYGSHLIQLRPGRWLVISLHDGRTLQLDSRTGNTVRVAGFRAFDASEAYRIVEMGASRLALIREYELAGDIIILNYSNGQMQRFSPPRCQNP